MWFDHLNLRDVVSDHWKGHFPTLPPYQLLHLKLKSACPILCRWNWEVFSHLDVNIANARADLARIQLEILNEGMLDAFHTAELQYQSALEISLRERRRFLGRAVEPLG